MMGKMVSVKIDLAATEVCIRGLDRQGAFEVGARLGVYDRQVLANFKIKFDDSDPDDPDSDWIKFEYDANHGPDIIGAWIASAISEEIRFARDVKVWEAENWIRERELIKS